MRKPLFPRVFLVHQPLGRLPGKTTGKLFKNLLENYLVESRENFSVAGSLLNNESKIDIIETDSRPSSSALSEECKFLSVFDMF